MCATKHPKQTALLYLKVNKKKKYKSPSKSLKTKEVSKRNWISELWRLWVGQTTTEIEKYAILNDIIVKASLVCPIR